MKQIEFFFDLSSPWTYLAFHNIQPIARESNASITWRPILVGGVFNAVNDSVYERRMDPEHRKNRHAIKSLMDWARLADLPLSFSRYHPLKSVNAMRMCCALEDNQTALIRLATAGFAAYFKDMRNLDEISELIDIANACDLDGPEIARRSQTDDVKARLRSNTQELIDRGGYGSPTIFVDSNDMYFGNDQLPLVRFALSR
jgi:2-hydroxychromene-2-carboxylate isomerase